jgi:hypothetical protein
MIDAMKQALAKFERLWEIGIDVEYKIELLPEIRILRQAIKAAENPDEPPDYVEPVTTDYHEGWEEGFKAGNALAPPKREQEAWDTSDMAHRSGGLSVEQEPVAWVYVNEDGECEQIEYGTDGCDDPDVQPLYTAPPKREWVCKKCGEQDVD